MTRRTKITIIAVAISAILGFIAFASIRQHMPANRGFGGEAAILLAPLLVYFLCKNITLSIDVFGKSARDELKPCFEGKSAQIISQPRRTGTQQSRMNVSINTQRSAEDYRK